MNQPDLLEAVPARSMAQASLEAYAQIQWTLQAREIAVFRLVHEYLEATGQADVTGGELAEWARGRMFITSIRPRLTGLIDKGWLHSGSIRPSRARSEGRCHPVWLAVPISAIERAERAKGR